MFDMNIFLDLIAEYEEENEVNALYENNLKFLVSKNFKEKIYADFCEKYFFKGITGIKDYYCVLKDENKILEKEILWTDDVNVISIVEIKTSVSNIKMKNFVLEKNMEDTVNYYLGKKTLNEVFERGNNEQISKKKSKN